MVRWETTLGYDDATSLARDFPQRLLFIAARLTQTHSSGFAMCGITRDRPMRQAQLVTFIQGIFVLAHDEESQPKAIRFAMQFRLFNLRWSRFAGQFGGKAKMDSGFDHAASFSSFSCLAIDHSSGVLPPNVE